MTLLLLRHFHCAKNSVSSVGLTQLEVVAKQLIELDVTTIVATTHTRVHQSALLISKLLPIKLYVVQSTAKDCIEMLSEHKNAVILSQQPILAEIASKQSGVNVDLSTFPTGKLVEVTLL